jgi:hypothetical protein
LNDLIISSSVSNPQPHRHTILSNFLPSHLKP